MVSFQVLVKAVHGVLMLAADKYSVRREVSEHRLLLLLLLLVVVVVLVGVLVLGMDLTIVVVVVVVVVGVGGQRASSLGALLSSQSAIVRLWPLDYGPSLRGDRGSQPISVARQCPRGPLSSRGDGGRSSGAGGIEEGSLRCSRRGGKRG